MVVGMADIIGTDIGRYHVIEKLGQGGMATVYKAFDTRLERAVAIKIIRQGAIASDLHEAMFKRFVREAKALARMSHTHIIKVYDYGDHEGSPYLVMEYLTGGTLSLKLTGKPVRWQEAARLLAPIARALEYAHREGILHRDVKPANILLNKDGQPMLSDFGIAKMLDVDASTQLTGTNMGIGTPDYMAPEQWLGKPVPQTDMYALGVVFYELVTGRRPYSADTPAAVMLKQASEPLLRPRSIVPDLPEEVELILIKVLEKNPDERYTSMSEFAAAMESLGVVTAPQPAQTVASQVEKEPDATQADILPKKSKVTPQKPAARPVPTVMDVVETRKTPAPAQAQPAEARLSNKRMPGWLWGAVGITGLAILVVAVMALSNGLAAKRNQNVTQTMLAAGQQTNDAAQVFAAAVTSTDTPQPSVTATETVPPPTETTVPTDTTAPTITSTKPPTQEPESKTEKIAWADGMTQVYIHSGEFTMGSDRGALEERPAHKVFLDGYWMDKTEVTISMFKICTDAGACPSSGHDDTLFLGDYPVIASWEVAVKYCKWAGRRLPTEAEWEKAARGTDERVYAWGDWITCKEANWFGFVDNGGCKPGTTRVGSYPAGASPYGLLDMTGNVSEWVADWYDPTYYVKSPDENPMGPTDGSIHIARGGSYAESVGFVTTYRRRYNMGNAGIIGFRCAVSQ
jgi:eukaryotic-like serine/threonine-protein kinase